MGRWRSGLALMAAVLALIAAALTFIDRAIVTHEAVAVVPALLAVASTALALWPTDGDWSARRRLTGVVIAIAWVAAEVAFDVFIIAVAGCACPATSNPYVEPAPLGISARLWILAAMLAGPVLLLIAAALPGRLGARSGSDLA